MKKGLRILVTVLAVVIGWIIIAGVTPVSYEECIAESFSDDKILFESESIEFGDNKGILVTSFESNGEYYAISIIETTAGIFNNQNTVKSSSTYYGADALNEALKKPNLKDMNYVDILYNEDNSGCYCGIVPIDCKSLSFDGRQAALIEQSVTVEGKEFDFYFYYLPTEYKESCEIEYIDVNNNLIS